MKHTQKTYRLTLSALFAALCCVMTMMVQIPVPTAGYIHFGDVFVLLSGWLLGFHGVIAAGIGSMFADIFSGYAAYAPITFLDKAATAAVAWLVFALLRKVLPRKLAFVGLLLSAILGELVMAAGYIGYEWFLYGFGKAILNLVPYLIKGGISVALACLLYPVTKRILGRMGV
ncbi:MAG: ECF transporter S component [Clostridia bacterium]|nr:ECF transporter S component [Clostridia bacterium]